MVWRPMWTTRVGAAEMFFCRLPCDVFIVFFRCRIKVRKTEHGVFGELRGQLTLRQGGLSWMVPYMECLSNIYACSEPRHGTQQHIN